VVFVQYWPNKPTPLPAAAVLMNDAPVTALLTAPGERAMAWISAFSSAGTARNKAWSRRSG
jgi:hypothetical protein